MFKFLDTVNATVKTFFYLIIWGIIDGVIIRVLVSLLRALGPLSNVFGDNAVARFLRSLPDSPMPITAYVWSLIGWWIILIFIGWFILQVLKYRPSGPNQPTVFEIIVATLTRGTYRVSQRTADETEQLARRGLDRLQEERMLRQRVGDPVSSGWIIRIGSWRIRIGGRR